MTMDPVVLIGKEGFTPENTRAIEEALTARELIKAGCLKNCTDDVRSVAEMAAGRTHSEVVQVIGKKFVLYREGKENKKKIVLPRG